MITRMTRVEIIGFKEHYQEAVECLQSWGQLHIDDASSFDEASSLKKFELDHREQEERRLRVEFRKLLSDIMGHFPRKLEGAPEFNTPLEEEVDGLSLAESLSRTKKLSHQLQTLILRKKKIVADLIVLREHKSLLEDFQPLVPERSCRFWIYLGIVIKRGQKEVPKLLRDELEKITGGRHGIIPVRKKGEITAILIGFNPRYEGQIKDLLFGEGISELSLSVVGPEVPLEEALLKIKYSLLQLPKEGKTIDSEIVAFFRKYVSFLRTMNGLNEDRLSRLEATSSFIHSKYTFSIHGWVPGRKFKALASLLKRDFQGKVVINKLPVPRGHEGMAPVKLWNPKPFHVFEKVVSFFALPKYGTIDPTPHMSIFFPLFFAFIVGDVGYGLVLTAIGIGMYIAFKRKGLLGDMGLITIIIGVLCIGFGFAYGEFFGIRSWFHPLVPQLARGHLNGINSDQIIINYLLLSLALGVIQVVLGIFLGIYNSFRIRHVRHALEGIAKLGALAGTIILVGRLVEFLSPVFLYIGGGTLAGSLLAWSIIGGPMAVIELTVLITNVLSYIRLMAVGMAAVAFTSIAGVFGEMLGNPVLGVIVIVGIHAFNMALHTFTPTVQSLRLHYVEFFTKFLVPGGKAYEPFRRIDEISRKTA